MLSFEHVRTKRKGHEIVVEPLKGALRDRSLELAAALVSVARSRVGETREALENAFDELEVGPREKLVFQGLVKLVDDHCEFESEASIDPIELRREIFSLSAERRRAGNFERGAVVGEVAARHSATPQTIEKAIYADLKSAHRLVKCEVPDAEALLSLYERAQVQAVLLRATKVTANVRCRSADAYRELFRKLKFRQLLHKIAPLDGGGYRLEIDGPFSLFDSVAKYGLELALTLPALEACDDLELTASIRPREGNAPLTFRYRSGGVRESGEVRVRDDVAELLAALEGIAGEEGLEVALSERILDLPGLGLCVPDLVLRSKKKGRAKKASAEREEVYVELLGFWSRDSVWKRVELVERGLSQRIVFAVSSRLRVSEEVLDESSSASLYVYKGRINPRALLRSVLGVLGSKR
jgi:predicted nuclease of restriction endonuclease-like RecB superfamily